jgi:hypothetical protein
MVRQGRAALPISPKMSVYWLFQREHLPTQYVSSNRRQNINPIIDLPKKIIFVASLSARFCPGLVIISG